MIKIRSRPALFLYQLIFRSVVSAEVCILLRISRNNQMEESSKALLKITQIQCIKITIKLLFNALLNIFRSRLS